MIVPDRVFTATDVAHHYDELDPIYRRFWGDHLHHGYWRTGRESELEAVEAMVELVGERLAPMRGVELCDIGCGYGASAEQLACANHVSVTGFTLSEAQANVARNRRPAAGAVSFIVRDWLDNGVPDEAFDGAYAIESSEHMVDKKRFFTEAWRVLRPGGRLVVCAWLAGQRPSRWQVRHLLEPICREGRLPGMGSRFDYEDMAADSGFQAIQYEDISARVGRTWTICALRAGRALMTDRDFRRFAFSRSTQNRDFLFSLPRLIIALRGGTMRYGIFTWQKPLGVNGIRAEDRS
jgi:tocopherol O-methyltransferase